MGTVQIIRTEVPGASGTHLVGRSPARTLLGGVDIPEIGLTGRFLGALDLILLQKSGYDFVEVPAGLRSRLFGAEVTTCGGGLGTIEGFEDPLQPVVRPLVVIAPQSWPPPTGISVWRRLLPQSAIQPGLAVNLVLEGEEISGEITQAPQYLPYWDAYHSALAAQGKFSTTLLSTAVGAAVVPAHEPDVLLGMLIAVQSSGGETLCNIFPLASLQPGGPI